LIGFHNFLKFKYSKEFLDEFDLNPDQLPKNILFFVDDDNSVDFINFEDEFNEPDTIFDEYELNQFYSYNIFFGIYTKYSRKVINFDITEDEFGE